MHTDDGLANPKSTSSDPECKAISLVELLQCLAFTKCKTAKQISTVQLACLIAAGGNAPHWSWHLSLILTAKNLSSRTALCPTAKVPNAILWGWRFLFSDVSDVDGPGASRCWSGKSEFHTWIGLCCYFGLHQVQNCKANFNSSTGLLDGRLSLILTAKQISASKLPSAQLPKFHMQHSGDGAFSSLMSLM